MADAKTRLADVHQYVTAAFAVFCFKMFSFSLFFLTTF